MPWLSTRGFGRKSAARDMTMATPATPAIRGMNLPAPALNTKPTRANANAVAAIGETRMFTDFEVAAKLKKLFVEVNNVKKRVLIA
jgi:hypothetical protein